MLPGPDVVFAAEPVLHPALEQVERNAVATFHQTICDGQGVVEDRIVGEVTHGEAVNPADRAGVRFALWVDAIDVKSKGKHWSGIPQAKSVKRGESTGTVCVGPASFPLP